MASERELMSQLAQRLNISSFNASDYDNDVSRDDDSELSGLSDVSGFSQISSDEDHKHRRDDSRKIAALQSELSEKDRLVQTLQRDRATLAATWQERYQRLEDAKAAAESQLRAQLITYESEVKRRQTQTHTEVAALKATLAELQQDGPLLRSRLTMTKDDLRDLSCTDEMYAQIKSIPEAQQSLREFVLQRHFEAQRALVQRLDPIRSENASLREKLAELEDRCAHSEREQARVTRSAADMERDLRRDIEQLEFRNRALAEEVGKLQARVRESADAVEQFDMVRAKLDMLEREHSGLTTQQLMMSMTSKSLAEEKEVTGRRVADLESTIEMLRLDKAYLTKETESLNQRNQELTKERDRLSSKYQEVKKAKDELYNKLLESRDEQKLGYESKLTEELTKLTERSKLELDEIRLKQRDAYEREIKALREAREAAIKEAELHREEARGRQAAYDQLMLEHRQLEVKLEAQLSEVRNLLKMRSFECERLQLVHDEHLKDHRALKLEHEKLDTKFEILRNDYYSLQTDATKRRTALETELEHVRDKLSAYEQLEYELDVAVMNAGQATEFDVQSAASSYVNGGVVAPSRAHEDMFTTLSATLPAASKRRIKQSILLAQKLMEKHRECESLKQQLNASKSEFSDAAIQLESAREQLKCVEQPYNYLIDQLAARDKQLHAAADQHQKLQREIESLTANFNSMVAQKQRLEQELANILHTRQNLDVLRALLSHAKSVVSLELPIQQVSLEPPSSSSAASTSTSEQPQSITKKANTKKAALSPPSKLLSSPRSSSASSSRPSAASKLFALPSFVRSESQLKTHTFSSPSLNASISSDQPRPIWYQQLTQNKLGR